MAHYVGSVNLYEHENEVRASLKVFRVFEFGARPSRPVWEAVVPIPPPTEWNSRAWLLAALEELLKQ